MSQEVNTKQDNDSTDTHTVKNKIRSIGRRSFIDGNRTPGHLYYKLKDAIDNEDLDALMTAYSPSVNKQTMESREKYKEVFKSYFEKKSQLRVKNRCSQFRLELMERTWDPTKPMNLWRITENMKWILENE